MNTTGSLRAIEDPLFQALCVGLVKEMKRLKVPGIAIGLYHGGQKFTAGFGVTSLEHPLPVTADTLFQIGSITKTLTATMIMMLVEQGRVDLEAPVRTYIRDLKLHDQDAQKHVTVRHLLTHTGGWVGDYFNDFGNGDEALARMVQYIGQLQQIQPLGTIWSYNNTGFNLAARIIEIVMEQPYETAVQNMLFDPLGLKMSFFYPSDLLFTHRFAVGHQRDKETVEVARPWAIGRAANSVGGVVTTVPDLLCYARFHMGRGRKGLISGRTLRAMRLPQVDIGGGERMGLTWFIRNEGELQIFGHSGSTKGQQADLFFIPEQRFALILLANSDDGYNLSRGLYKHALRLYFNTELKIHRPVWTPPAKLRQYTGRYKIGTGCFDLKVKGKYLIYHEVPLGGFPKPDSPPGPLTPPIRLQFYEPDKVVGLDEPYKEGRGEFLRDEQGEIKYFRIFARAHQKIK